MRQEKLQSDCLMPPEQCVLILSAVFADLLLCCEKFLLDIFPVRDATLFHIVFDAVGVVFVFLIELFEKFVGKLV